MSFSSLGAALAWCDAFWALSFLDKNYERLSFSFEALPNDKSSVLCQAAGELARKSTARVFSDEQATHIRYGHGSQVLLAIFEMSTCSNPEDWHYAVEGIGVVGEFPVSKRERRRWVNYALGILKQRAVTKCREASIGNKWSWGIPYVREYLGPNQDEDIYEIVNVRQNFGDIWNCKVSRQLRYL